MITTNTGAKKLESSDNWREIFPNPGTGTAGAHNASVDAHDRIQAEVAPIINGKRCSLGAASGDFVLLRNSTIAGKTDGAYVAAKAIPANTDLDSTYLGSAITGGIANELNNNLTRTRTGKIPCYGFTLGQPISITPADYKRCGIAFGIWATSADSLKIIPFKVDIPANSNSITINNIRMYDVGEVTTGTYDVEIYTTWADY